ncbi:MAG TPA: hypothetical protein PKD10_15875 [Paracoccaceae bacterium]|nr:hypothetical protein [Paracoccaceae bacterium]
MPRLAALAVAAALVAGPAGAQTVRVQSGEHDGFSRLVLVLPCAAEWDLRREVGGYRLSFPNQQLRFDLSGVFRLIPRNRLAAIRSEPEEGALVLGLACACHAVAYEDRPGVLVLDLRDGPAPEGSSWERAADGSPMPPLSGRSAIPRPRPRPGSLIAVPDEPTGPSTPAVYDWRELADPAGMAPRGPGLTPPRPPVLDRIAEEGRAEDDGLRRRIIEDLARGAARGVIDMVVPEGGSPGTTLDDTAPAAPAQLRVRGEGQVAALDEPRMTGELADTGDACLSDADLALEAWGDVVPPSHALGPRTMAVLGEFDRPDAGAALAALRYLLYLGFGAEAQAMIALAEGSVPAEPHRTIARILDGETPPGPAFDGMQGCPTAAAMWAVLALPDLAGQPRVDTGAVLRAFSALPVHLRRHLGPPLADRFLARNDNATARALRDAILRAPGDPGDPVRLLETEIERSEGRVPGRQALTELGATSGETGVRATIALLQAEAQAGRIPPEPLVTGAEAMLGMVGDTTLGQDLRAALAPALAANGQIDRAMAMAGTGPGLAAVWAAIAAVSPDGIFLIHAVRSPGTPLPALPATTRQAIAERLVTLGFPGAAIGWLPHGAPAGGSDATAEALLRAQAELASFDARAALATLRGLEGEAAQTLRAEALVLARDASASAALRSAGLADRAAAEDRRRRDWVRVAEAEEPWGPAARAALGDPADRAALPPLAAGAAMAEDSAAAREAVATLLAATPRP